MISGLNPSQLDQTLSARARRDGCLGVGVGLRPPHYPDYLAGATPEIQWLELISENYMDVGGRPRRIIRTLRERYPMALHGVSMSLGADTPPSRSYLSSLRELIQEIEPIVVSDHLSFSKVREQFFYDLLPLRFDDSTLSRLVEHIDFAQNTLGRTILIENPSQYIRYAYQIMEECDFITELCQRTGCGLLLDLNNLYVNAHNIGLDPQSYLKKIPQDMVGQFHLAGHTVTDHILIDTHSSLVCDGVWELYDYASRRWPEVPTLLEWDAEIPALSVLVEEVQKAKAVQGKAIDGLSQPTTELVAARIQERHILSRDRTLALNFSGDPDFSERDPLDQWAGFLRSPNPDLSADSWRQLLTKSGHTSPEDGLRVYRNNFYGGVSEAMRHCFQALAGRQTEDEFDVWVMDYLLSCPQSSFSIDRVGAGFADFLGHYERLSYDQQRLYQEVAAFEFAKWSLFLNADKQKPFLAEDLLSLDASGWESLKVSLLSHQRFCISEAAADFLGVEWGQAVAYRDPGENVQVFSLHPQQSLILEGLKENSSVLELIQDLSSGSQAPTSEELLTQFIQLVSLGLIGRVPQIQSL
jgi:uncharacterized protein (UPF0276 family)